MMKQTVNPSPIKVPKDLDLFILSAVSPDGAAYSGAWIVPRIEGVSVESSAK